uniref:Uncharacterized protein n=1 Tax=Oryza brachyantha TaxID=4533 RepID=J3MEQ4_ORYBR
MHLHHTYISTSSERSIAFVFMAAAAYSSSAMAVVVMLVFLACTLDRAWTPAGAARMVHGGEVDVNGAFKNVQTTVQSSKGVETYCNFMVIL